MKIKELAAIKEEMRFSAYFNQGCEAGYGFFITVDIDMQGNTSVKLPQFRSGDYPAIPSALREIANWVESKI